MAMTVLVTQRAPDRVRGFLASCMCEVAPGVYVSSTMNKAVRTRVWTVLQRWFVLGSDASVLMVWVDRGAAAGLGLAALGTPRYDAHEFQALTLVRRDSTRAERSSLTTEDEVPF